MEQLKKSFPPGVDYTIVYNPTEFIAESVNAVYETLFEAMVLVVLVVLDLPADPGARRSSRSSRSPCR